MKKLIIHAKFSSTYPYIKPHPTCRIATMWNRSHTHLLLLTICFLFMTAVDGSWSSTNDNGVFLQLPFSSPPTVRPPPYANSNEQCPGFNERENWIGNLCGDLNTGKIPLNPLGHKFGDDGTTFYPFEIIKNKTLLFFRHALPVLKNDKSLPKVARFNPYDTKFRPKRSLNTASSKVQDVVDDPIEPRVISHSHSLNYNSNNNRFCENPSSTSALICRVYNVMWGQNSNNHYHQSRHRIHDQDRRDSHDNHVKNYRQRAGAGGKDREYLRQRERPQQAAASNEIRSRTKPDIQKSQADSLSLPPTPCPSSAEYLTPVFARNHEGAWRYVVQIPREGYFTQTVEVTKCTETNCYYMDGTCRTSPRWQSLLVAEVFYPDTEFPVSKPSHSQLKSKRSRNNDVEVKSKENGASIPPQCDGLDEIGCFQVRLFYDWFLIPGSCKCWKKQFDFTRV